MDFIKIFVSPDTLVYRTYEEAYYKVILDMCGYTVRYNRIVSSLALDYDELKDMEAISLPEKLSDEKVGCSDKELEKAQQNYYRAEGIVASHLDGDKSFSEEELSDRTSIETKPKVIWEKRRSK